MDEPKSLFQRHQTAFVIGAVGLGSAIGVVVLGSHSATTATPPPPQQVVQAPPPTQNQAERWFLVHNGEIVFGEPYKSDADCEDARHDFIKKYAAAYAQSRDELVKYRRNSDKWWEVNGYSNSMRNLEGLSNTMNCERKS